MQFSIITPTSKHTMKVSFIEVETLTGNLVIQTGYAPSLIMLKPKSTVIAGFSNGTTETFSALSGILQVARETAQLLVDV